MMKDNKASTMTYGLIGRKLPHSWSQSFFTERFDQLKLDASYANLEYATVEAIDKNQLLRYHGLNVTIPYKEAIIPLLDELTPLAQEIGAVNCIAVCEGRLIGHNTDAYGFRDSLRPFLKSWHRKALILGTGGASKAIAYVLDQLGIEYRLVSRTPSADEYSYADLNAKAMEIFPFIINCTPIGLFPNVDEAPLLPYDSIGKENLLYDLVYNPTETLFLKQGKDRGAQTINGLHMLIGQAEASWRIWDGQSAQPAID